jgi:hypothetical protein
MDVAKGGSPNAEIGGRDTDNDDDDLGDPQVEDGLTGEVKRARFRGGSGGTG